MKSVDSEALAKNDGKDGNSAYVAAHGKVYDVTASNRWKGGVHMKRHHAGADLTTDIQAAPHGPEVLERFRQVGTLEKKRDEPEMPVFLSNLLKRFPMFRRHPHPMTVHFPIVFMFSTTAFNLLYLTTGIRSFETTATHCLGAGVFFTAVAIMTGFYTWWLNFQARPVRAVTIKKRVSVAMLATAVVALSWRMARPDILDTIGGADFLYLLLVLAVFPMVTVIGWFGAQLTFPIERE